MGVGRGEEYRQFFIFQKLTSNKKKETAHVHGPNLVCFVPLIKHKVKNTALSALCHGVGCTNQSGFKGLDSFVKFMSTLVCAASLIFIKQRT